MQLDDKFPSPQPEKERVPALLSTSNDRMYDSQYLRVTLKSITDINMFLIKAVNRTHQDREGE